MAKTRGMHHKSDRKQRGRTSINVTPGLVNPAGPRLPVEERNDTTRPIFQATVPAAPPTMKANYTALSVVVNVDLKPGVLASSITSDGDLFMRDQNGAITGTTDKVQTLQVTSSILVLPLQFAEDAP